MKAAAVLQKEINKAQNKFSLQAIKTTYPGKRSSEDSVA